MAVVGVLDDVDDDGMIFRVFYDLFAQKNGLIQVVVICILIEISFLSVIAHFLSVVWSIFSLLSGFHDFLVD